jgi:hypothetical protein
MRIDGTKTKPSPVMNFYVSCVLRPPLSLVCAAVHGVVLLLLDTGVPPPPVRAVRG